uniref:Uncharacterized protein n=1 Tax=Salmonella sp. TaxID=599 RepID=A0A482ETQ8_SALSP|nr:hypothetical protein NNIBIDOC_00086 [Salmonella sp.]
MPDFLKKRGRSAISLTACPLRTSRVLFDLIGKNKPVAPTSSPDADAG